MNKTTLITLFILVVVAIVAVVMFRSTSPAAAPSLSGEEPSPLASVASTPEMMTPSTQPVVSTSPTATVGTATVSITDAGFVPDTITVAPGTTVTFVNNGQGAHWVASNPHPTHTDLPGFDAKRGLTTGESYSFTFTQVGSWGYHDHLNPRLHGTVVVK